MPQLTNQAATSPYAQYQQYLLGGGNKTFDQWFGSLPPQGSTQPSQLEVPGGVPLNGNNAGTPQQTSTGIGQPTTPQYISPLPTYSAPANNALGATTAYSQLQQQNQNPFVNPSMFGGSGTQNQYSSPLGFYGSPSGGTGFYQQ